MRAWLRLMLYRLRKGRLLAAPRDGASLLVLGTLVLIALGGITLLRFPLAVSEISPLVLPPSLPSQLPHGLDTSWTSPITVQARRVDAALAESLDSLGLDGVALIAVQEEARYDTQGDSYPFKRIFVPADGVKADALFKAARRSLGRHMPRVRLQREGEGLHLVSWQGHITHTLRVGNPPVFSAWNLERPLLAIIIDDMGENLPAARKLLTLPFPVTFSIWPHSTHAAYCATLAREYGMDVMIHQPMEPLAGERAAIEPDTLRVGDSREDIRKILARSLSRVPSARGLNNHMGSRFTSDLVSVQVLLEELKELQPHLYVVDSLTHDASVFYEEARRQGFTAWRRTLFLDDASPPRARILQYLDEGMALARKHGSAVVIGHPRTETLAALAAWKGYQAGDVLIVPLSLMPKTP